MISKEALDNKYKALENSRRVQLTISKATALFMFKSTHEPAKIMPTCRLTMIVSIT